MTGCPSTWPAPTMVASSACWSEADDSPLKRGMSPSGAGTVAWLPHQSPQSSRGAGPFVRLFCPLLSPCPHPCHVRPHFAATATDSASPLHQRSGEFSKSASRMAPSFRIPFELMRVYSPSAEVPGPRPPVRRTLQTGKRGHRVSSGPRAGGPLCRPADCSRTATSTGIYTWEYLYFLGSQQEAELWKPLRGARLVRSRAPRRDAPMTANAHVHDASCRHAH